MKAWRMGIAAALAVVALVWTGAGACGEQYYSDNVVIVLDASGSMKNAMSNRTVTKMDAAKQALKEVLKRIPETTHLGLLVFSSANLQEDWVYPLGPRQEAELMRAIDLPEPGGQTPLGAYIKKGTDRLLEARKEQLGYGTYRLLIVTDGEANDPDLVDRYTPEAVARGVTIDVIGVDMKTDHTLARQVHSYRRADDPASLQQAIAEVFAEVSSAGKDAVEPEDFRLLDPIPLEMAVGMLDALTRIDNTPLGGGSGASGGGVSTVPPGGATPGGTPSSGGSGTSRAVYVIAFVLLFVILAFVRKRRRKGASR